MRLLRRGFIIASIFISPLAAASADDLFAQQNWQEALTAYHKQAVPTPSTLQRMGACAAQLNKPAEAVLYWRRAQKQAVLGSYLKLSRMIAGAQHAGGVGVVSHPVISFLSNGVCAVPLLFWQMVLLLLWGLLLWRGRRLYRTARIGWLVTLVCFVLLGACVVYYCYQCRTKSIAVIMKSTPVRTGPSERYTQLSALSAASEATILDAQKGPGNTLFYKVQAGSERGWVQHSTVTVV